MNIAEYNPLVVMFFDPTPERIWPLGVSLGFFPPTDNGLLDLLKRAGRLDKAALEAVPSHVPKGVMFAVEQAQLPDGSQALSHAAILTRLIKFRGGDFVVELAVREQVAGSGRFVAEVAYGVTRARCPMTWDEVRQLLRPLALDIPDDPNRLLVVRKSLERPPHVVILEIASTGRQSHIALMCRHKDVHS